ncbi:MAG: hypothetical protein KatS3mg060_0435 [Dehalococcoidia bacterium]|nr:MAG: hypothetical protein KatS3mg060_0435 [Dehalococcoidia bacterium]
MPSLGLVRTLTIVLAALTALIVAGSSAPSTAHADTPVSGTQTGTWTRENSPYIVTESVDVPNGGTLTIEPGVEVRFQANKRLSVRGTGKLIAEGTASQPITFTAAVTNPSPGAWHRLEFETNATGRLAHCRVEYAGHNGANVHPAVSVNGSNVDYSRLYYREQPWGWH